jgi:hypothetical protein
MEAYLYAGGDPVNADDPMGALTCRGWLRFLPCGLITDIQNAVSGLFKDAGKYAGAIAALASAAAVILAPVPIAGEVVGIIAVGAGSWAAAEDLEHRQYVEAVLDVAGVLVGGGSLLETHVGEALQEVAWRNYQLGPVTRWLTEDANTARRMGAFLSRNAAAISGASFGASELVRLITRDKKSTER